MAATLLAEGEFVLTNVPAIADVDTMSELLAALGVKTKWLGPHELSLTNSGNISTEAPFENVDKIRASINVLGPLLTHYGQALINWPGGGLRRAFRPCLCREWPLRGRVSNCAARRLSAARPLGEPRAHLFCLVRAVVVHYQMQRLYWY